MYFDEEDCPNDIYFNIDELFLMKAEVDKFQPDDDDIDF